MVGFPLHSCLIMLHTESISVLQMLMTLASWCSCSVKGSYQHLLGQGSQVCGYLCFPTRVQVRQGLQQAPGSSWPLPGWFLPTALRAVSVDLVSACRSWAARLLLYGHWLQVVALWMLELCPPAWIVQHQIWAFQFRHPLHHFGTVSMPAQWMEQSQHGLLTGIFTFSR